MKLTIRSLLVAVLALAPLSAMATNGYFSHGYGIIGKGMGGATTGLAVDAMAPATNPAAMSFVTNQLDFGADLFSPRRQSEMTVPASVKSESDSKYFIMPELGYNRILMPETMTVGLTIYGNGGLNTDYPALANGSNLLGGTGKMGVNMSQMIVAPSFTYRVAKDHSFGIAPLFGWVRFEANGLQAFDSAMMTSAVGSVTNNGIDNATGYGARIGYFGKILPNLSVGAAYSTKLYMSKFKKYAGLFAEQGDFDIPANYNVGVGYSPIEGLQLSADFTRILYSGVRSIANSSANQAQLGTTDGPGFGWRNQSVYKVGVQYKVMPALTVRGGWNYGKMPIRSEDTMFGILAPATVEHHLTLGGTYDGVGPGSLSLAYMHAFEKKLSTDNAMQGAPTIQMYEDSFGMAYSWKL